MFNIFKLFQSHKSFAFIATLILMFFSECLMAEKMEGLERYKQLDKSVYEKGRDSISNKDRRWMVRFSLKYQNHFNEKPPSFKGSQVSSSSDRALKRKNKQAKKVHIKTPAKRSNKHVYIEAVPAKDIAAIHDDMLKAYQGEQYKKSIAFADSAIAEMNYDGLALMIKGLSLLEIRDFKRARQYLNYARMTLGNDYVPYIGLAYLELAESGSLKKAKKWIDLSMRLASSDQVIADLTSEALTFEKKFKRPKLYTQLKNYASSKFKAYNKGGKTNKVNAEIQAAMASFQLNNVQQSKNKFDKAIKSMKQASYPPAAIMDMMYYAASAVKSMDNGSVAMTYWKQGLTYSNKNKVDNPYLYGLISSLIAESYYGHKNYDSALQYASTGLKVGHRQPFDYISVKLLKIRLEMYFIKHINGKPLGKNIAVHQQQINDAKTLISIAARMGKVGPQWKMLAFNSLGNTYSSILTRQSLEIAMRYYNQSLDIAHDLKDKQMATDVQSNIANVFYRMGGKDKAVSVYQKLAEKEKQKGDYQGAALILNNLGAILFAQKNYTAAISALKDAVKIVEHSRKKVSVTQRKALLEQEVSAYQFLIMAYGKMGNTTELYDAMEKIRGRVMVETLANKQNIKRADISWLQKRLAADEVALLYSVAEFAGSVVISVVTKDGVHTEYPEDLKFHNRLSQRFAKAYGVAIKQPEQASRGFNPFDDRGQNKMTNLTSLLRSTMENKTGLKKKVNNAMRDDVLRSYYSLLIKPVEKYLVNKKRLIISPDGYLSFIPFDSLIDNKGKYLVERFVTRYTPSMTIFRMVSERNYSPKRKNILAFGDAHYAAYKTSKTVAQDKKSFVDLVEDVASRFKKGISQRKNYAKLGIGGRSWSYLKGTKTEVEEIKRRIPSVDIKLNKQFTENKIKKMSANGQLAKYKVLHIATHGVVVPSIPEMSTIVTSLSKKEINKEDGYLTAYEIKDLKLNADFVALSACQTGLGKIYAGEGVAGLNSALLLAGANATSVSLWSVSDYGTMRLMVGLYDLVHNKKQTYADAMAQMKRKFISGLIKDSKGRVYNNPKYWAPFVYYGR
jgi:CHAT domain-containing protein/tetratricopeptide (TPR) repeat protein